jgi:5,5'-dehydrodivanillate O-demethylase
MLTEKMNDRLTKVGPGTPAGNVMRRYWHPIAASVELLENPVKKVRLLCEDLVLYKDRSGNLGLIDEPCPHRRVSLEYGIPEEEGLRCPYHGWLFNHEGKCTEQPAEPWNSTFKDRVTTKAYPVQELGGFVFAYLGPQPAPLLPRYDLFVWDNVVRQIGQTLLPCNYLQCMENGLDPSHAEWLHGRFMRYVYEKQGGPNMTPLPGNGRHTRFGFDRFEHGVITRRIVGGTNEEDDIWRIGHAVVFPIIRRVGTTFQLRVPVDDTHTLHYNYIVYRPGVALPPQETVPLYDLPLTDEQGKYLVDVLLVQDFMAWSTQGPVAKRDLERLGQSDIGIIMWRQILEEQIDRVERGLEPMEVYRDPSQNSCISLPQDGLWYDVANPNIKANMFTAAQGPQPPSDLKFSAARDWLFQLCEDAEQRVARGEPVLSPVESPVYPIVPELHAELRLIPD